MDSTVIKIENTFVSFAHVKESKGVLHITRVCRAPLPEDLCGKKAMAEPEGLAEMLTEELRAAEMNAKRIDVFLGAGTERFTEYLMNASASKRMQKRREQLEAKDLLAKEDTPPSAWREDFYRYKGTNGVLSASAVFAAKAGFCERLVIALEKDGYTVMSVSSSLAAFAEVSKTLSSRGERVLVLCAEKNEYMMALFTEGLLARLARFPQGTEAPEPAAPLLPFIAEGTRVILCGAESENEKLRRALTRAGAEAVESVNARMKEPRERIALSEELAYKDELYPGVFPAAAFVGDISSNKEPYPFYISKEITEQKLSFNILTISAVALIVALFICAVSPVTLMLAERDLKATKQQLEDPYYADAAAKKSQYRALISEFTELTLAEENVPRRDPSYADVVEELKESLLADADIHEISYEKGKGLFVEFTTSDAKAFDAAKKSESAKSGMTIYEPGARNEISEGVWRIQIRVMLTLSAGEVQ